jgi:hypothetical protein
MHQFLKFILGMKLYMFRTVPLSIIRSFSLYTQQWYMSHRFADSLRYRIRMEHNQLDALNSQISSWNEILHVSDSSSVYHQEFFAVNSAMVYVIQVCWQFVSRIRVEHNQLDALISQIYSWNEILHVSESSSVYHQEFFAVHTAVVYVIQVCWQLALQDQNGTHPLAKSRDFDLQPEK